MAPRIAVIDYGSGNLRSVEKALQKTGAEPVRCADAATAEKCEAIVLPGVGSFGDCARSLEERGLSGCLRGWLAADRPYLGICLGYQILFDSSEESPEARGLGHWPGKVVRFEENPGRKVPHMGWNTLSWGARDEIFTGVDDGSHVFFVHSYYPAPTDESLVTAWCDYGGKFAAAAARGRVHGMQFHPEKSQEIGLHILENFVRSVSQNK
jgi:glutamine amidotransferase